MPQYCCTVNLNMKFLFITLLTSTCCIISSCNSSTSSSVPKNDEKAFESYWSNEKAEITSFQATQTINGQTTMDSVVMSFSLENMSKKRGIKLEEPKKHPGDAIEVLACHITHEYLIDKTETHFMTSVFTPTDYNNSPHSLKWVAGMQEANGQTYLQANYKGYRYETRSFSSDESEGDTEVKLVNTWLEDEIWNKIRVAPDELPLGKTRIVPSANYLRLSQVVLKEYDAVASLKVIDGNYQYNLEYPDLKRNVEITFEKVFPHKILGWQERDEKGNVAKVNIQPSVK